VKIEYMTTIDGMCLGMPCHLLVLSPQSTCSERKFEHEGGCCAVASEILVETISSLVLSRVANMFRSSPAICTMPPQQACGHKPGNGDPGGWDTLKHFVHLAYLELCHFIDDIPVMLGV
jgi:hypothetical protein